MRYESPAARRWAHVAGEGEPPASVDDSLRSDAGDRYDVVLTNPPFGKKSSIRVINEKGDEGRQALTVVRDDFWASTSNKQLNFLQRVKTVLKINGRAAVVVPGNVPFEGGAGETIRRMAAARVRRAHFAASPHRHLLRTGREGKRPFLR